MTRNGDTSILLLVIASLPIFAIFADSCDLNKCLGPIKYYQEMKCTPIYENPSDSCPVAYNCSHLNYRAKDKCYVNEHVYSVGQYLREEDEGLCDISCKCRLDPLGVASFYCGKVLCEHDKEVRPGCYKDHTAGDKWDRCCGKQICPNPINRTICRVDGTDYFEGTRFRPSSHPDKSCTCLPGFKGEFIEPYCKQVRCIDEVHQNGREILIGCVPIFHRSDFSNLACTPDKKCPHPNDYIIRQDANRSTNETSGHQCKVGQLTFSIGDELKTSSSPSTSSKCIQCTCEMPPFPTCRSLPVYQCERTMIPETPDQPMPNDIAPT